MKKTPLFGEHQENGGKIVDFSGWALPVQYEGIVREHQHTRQQASVFDCSHMGEFRIRGEDSVRAYGALICCDILGLKVGRARYGSFLNASGGIIDDIITLKLAEDELFVVSNAGPLERVAQLIKADVPGVEDISAQTAKIDIQGPYARDVLMAKGVEAAGRLKYFQHCRTKWRGVDILLSRTGYTGELGYEVFLPVASAVDFYRDLLAHAKVKPAGLGARDTLRTEMGYPLSGQDFDESRTPLELRMDSFISWDRPFRGKEALLAMKEDGGYPLLTAIKTDSRRAPRHGFEVFKDDTTVGVVTSGTYGPSVGHGIGFAFLPKELSEPGEVLKAGPRRIEVHTAKLPFYEKGTCRN